MNGRLHKHDGALLKPVSAAGAVMSKLRLRARRKAVAGVLMAVGVTFCKQAGLALSADTASGAMNPSLPQVPFNSCYDAYLFHEIGTFEKNAIERRILVDPFVRDRVDFYLGSDRGDLGAEVIDPEGKILHENDNAVTSRTRADGMKIWRVRNPKVGDWTIRTLPPDPDKKLTYILAVTGRGGNIWLRAESQVLTNADADRDEIPPDVLPARFIHIQARFVSKYHGIKNVAMTGTAYSPTGRVHRFEMHDDGNIAHGDQFPGDGVYTAVIPLTGQCTGKHHITLAADGREVWTAVPKDIPGILGPPDVFEQKSEPVPAFTRWTELEVTVNNTKGEE